ncbi:MAG: hypothetical protein MK179_21240, partial [Pirellulaceae bacterium]|nr:hypothetical protein [Pirellulaceae bacterium]
SINVAPSEGQAARFPGWGAGFFVPLRFFAYLMPNLEILPPPRGPAKESRPGVLVSPGEIG